MDATNGRVTLKMIAERAQTSIGTVDRVLNRRGGVNEARRQQILSLAETMGYSRNRFASALSRKRTVRIAMVYPDRPEEFYDSIAAGIDAAAAELADYGVAVEKVRYKSPLTAAEVLGSIADGAYDGLGVNSTGPGCDAQIDRLIAKGTPVITFNTDAPDTARLFYVGDNSRQMGRLGGELMSLCLGSEGAVAVMGRFNYSYQYVERLGGFCEYVQINCPSMRVRPCTEACDDPDQAKQTLENMLGAAPEPIRGVFCTGYTTTVGAIRAVRAAALRHIFLIGFDMGGEIKAAVQDGFCTALLYQSPVQQGYQAAHLLARHLLEGWTPERGRLYIEPRIVLKGNLEEYSDRALQTAGGHPFRL